MVMAAGAPDRHSQEYAARRTGDLIQKILAKLCLEVGVRLPRAHSKEAQRDQTFGAIIGPSLAGIYGTKAGDVAGYAFSPAMKASGLTWDDATLDRFLTQPMAAVPGTKMVYPGVKDPAKRAEVIAFLKTL